MTELFRALGVLCEPPSAGTEAIADALGIEAPLPPETEWTELFCFQLYPYASVHLGAEGMLGGEARDRVAGFWRALRLDPPQEPDHLATLLVFYAQLTAWEQAADEQAVRQLGRRARSALLWEHLLSWLPPYLARVEALGHPFYAGWARLLKAALAREAEEVGPPCRQPLHLREAPPLLDPRLEGGESLLTGLLAPVRSGLILARADLGRAADELGLGLRAGERAYVLRGLLDQDAPGTLRWLADEADRHRRSHLQQPSSFEPCTSHWADRAGATAAMLAELGQAATEATPLG